MARADQWQIDAFVSSLTAASPATTRAYRGDLEAFIEWTERLGIDQPGAVDRKTLRRYLSYLHTRGYARRTMARKASSLRRYFDFLRHVDVIDVSPATNLAAPKGGGRLPRVLRADEVAALLDDPVVDASPDPPAVHVRDDALLELLYGSGLRIGEVCGLDREDLDLDAATVRVWGKGGKQRQVR